MPTDDPPRPRLQQPLLGIEARILKLFGRPALRRRPPLRLVAAAGPRVKPEDCRPSECNPED